MPTVNAEPVRDIRPGRVLVKGSQIYVALTRPSTAFAKLPSPKLSHPDFRRVLPFRDPQGTMQYLEVLEVDRVEELDLLRELQDAVAIRFRGDYLSKKYPDSSFGGPRRRKIRSDDGALIGILNKTEKSFLKRPEDRRGDWKDTIVSLGESPHPTQVQAPVERMNQSRFSLLESLLQGLRKGWQRSPIG